MNLRKAAHIVICIFLLTTAVSCSGSSSTQSLPSLRDAFKNDFLIGAALNDNVVNGNDPNAAEIVEKQFNAITAENVMKWQIIHPEPNKYNFEPADRFVEFGLKNKMFIIGHTLVWHHQTPLWVFKGEDGNDVDRETLLARMKEHIFTIVGRYKGKVNGWDVVNEALADDGRLRRSKWLTIIGEDFIEKAFEYAHEADPDAELYYNDYSLENPGKCQGAVRIVKNLQAKGVHIDAVGCQGQAWRLDPGSPSRKDIQNFIDSISALGVKCMFTELCIDVLPAAFNNAGADIRANAELREELNTYPDGLPNDMQKKLAKRYAELFMIFRENSDKISRVTLWGVYDGTSWLNYWPVRGRTNYPLLFDRKYQPKPAFFAVMKTAQTKP